MVEYDGVNLESLKGIKVIYPHRPLISPIRINSKTLTGKDGEYFIERNNDPVTIPIDIEINADPKDVINSVRERVRALAAVLYKNEPKRLVFEDEKDKYINGIVESASEPEGIVKQKYTVTFRCSDPYYYAIEDEIFNFDTDGSHNFTREKGNIESLPLIYIYGGNTTGAINIKTDNTEINFNGRLNSGEILVLDSKLMTAYIIQQDGNTRSANNDLDNMIFPILNVGANNISATSLGNSLVERVTVYARSRWE